MREELIANPINRILYQVGPVDDDTRRAAFLNDDAFAVYYAHMRDDLIDFVVREYGLPRPIVEKLVAYDLMTWQGALRTGKAPRFESFRVRFTSRLQVFVKNRAVLADLSSLVCGTTEGYLDVGCGHGFTMLAAMALGHGVAHGIEVDPAFFKLGKQFFPDGLEAALGYADDDFLTLPVELSYSVITFFDVMEHIADYEVGVRKALDLCRDDGFIYFYQGNRDGVQMVRHEPHYRVPMLTQLPRELAIQILLRLNRITDPERYVVAKWPPFALFERDDCAAAIVRGPVNLRNGQTYLTEKQGDGALAALANEYKAVLGPILSADEMAVVDAAYADYARRYQEAKADPHLHERLFLMNSWNIILAKDETVLAGGDRLGRMDRAPQPIEVALVA